MSAAPIGHNNPPTLAEELEAETTADRKRATDLVEAANNSRIEDAETQRQVTALAGLIKTEIKLIGDRRVARKRPFDEGAAAVQTAYKPMIDSLNNAVEALRYMNDRWEREQDRAREAERRRLAAEQAEQQRLALEAQRAAEEAKAAGQSGITADLARIKAEEAAEQLRREQEAIRPEPVRTDLGSSHQTTVRSFAIVDHRKLLAFLGKNHGQGLLDALQPLVDRLGRARVEMPGVKVVETQSTRWRT